MKTLANIPLELEFFAGKVLKYIDYPPDVCMLAQCLSSLPEQSPNINIEAISKIKKIVVHKDGRLNIGNLFKFYRADLSELVELLGSLILELELLLPVLESIKLAEHDAYILKVFHQLESLQDYGYLAKFMAVTPPEPYSVIEIQAMQMDIRTFITNAQACLSLYGSGINVSMPTKTWKFDTQQNVSNSVYFLQQQLSKTPYPIKLISNVLGATQIFSQLSPQMTLDPLYKDTLDDLHRFFLEPDTYESACKNKQVSEKVGGFFSSIYSEFTKQAGLDLMKSYNRDSEDEKICIENGLGIVRDSGALTILCSQFVNKNYKQG